MKDRELNEALERLVDEHGLVTVLAALEGVCYDKEAHVLECWQDEGLASTWSKAARALGRLADKLGVGA